MKVYVVYETAYMDSSAVIHGVFDNKAVAEMRAMEVAGDVHEFELNAWGEEVREYV